MTNTSTNPSEFPVTQEFKKAIDLLTELVLPIEPGAEERFSKQAYLELFKRNRTIYVGAPEESGIVNWAICTADTNSLMLCGNLNTKKTMIDLVAYYHQSTNSPGQMPTIMTYIDLCQAKEAPYKGGLTYFDHIYVFDASYMLVDTPHHRMFSSLLEFSNRETIVYMIG